MPSRPPSVARGSGETLGARFGEQVVNVFACESASNFGMVALSLPFGGRNSAFAAAMRHATRTSAPKPLARLSIQRFDR